MSNLINAVAYAEANENSSVIYYAATAEDVRNRLALELPEDTFDSKALLATLDNGSTILFVVATGRPEQGMALKCDAWFKDDALMANSAYNLGGVPQGVMEGSWPKEG